MFMFQRIYANSFLFFMIGLKKIKICLKSDPALCSYISALAVSQWNLFVQLASSMSLSL